MIGSFLEGHQHDLNNNISNNNNNNAQLLLFVLFLFITQMSSKCVAVHFRTV